MTGIKQGHRLHLQKINCLFNPSMPHFRVKYLTVEGSLDGRGPLEPVADLRKRYQRPLGVDCRRSDHACYSRHDILNKNTALIPDTIIQPNFVHFLESPAGHDPLFSNLWTIAPFIWPHNPQRGTLFTRLRIKSERQATRVN